MEIEGVPSLMVTRMPLESNLIDSNNCYIPVRLHCLGWGGGCQVACRGPRTSVSLGPNFEFIFPKVYYESEKIVFILYFSRPPISFRTVPTPTPSPSRYPFNKAFMSQGKTINHCEDSLSLWARNIKWWKKNKSKLYTLFTKMYFTSSKP